MHGTILTHQGLSPSILGSEILVRAAVQALPYKQLREQQRKVVIHEGHGSCASDDDHLTLLIQTDHSHQQSKMSQITIAFSKK